jgi:hypothetical protein
MTADAHIPANRAAVYQALRRRNRIVLLLRVLVPLAGAVLLGLLGVQLIITNLSKDFSIGRVSIERNRLSVDAPSYAGQLADGSFYRVGADRAEASLADASLIDLTAAGVSLTRPNGVELRASAPVAQLDTDEQAVDVPGLTSVSDSTGGTGTLSGLHLDFSGQTFTASGPVHFAFGTGETLTAANMRYDAAAHRWQFARVTLTLTGTSGETLPEPIGTALKAMTITPPGQP